MSKYLSYKHRHTLRRFMAMVFAVMLALSPLQAIVMAESSYFDPIEGASIEWESISPPEYPENNNEETNTPSDNYPSETATDENNTAETGTEEQPSNNNEDTSSTPPTGDGATDEPSNEENATEEPSGDAGSDNPSEDATDEPTDDATEPSIDDATEPGTDDATDEPTEEEPTEEPTDDDLLSLLPIIVPPIVFSGSNYWTVTFWADHVDGTELSMFRTPYGEEAVIPLENWPTPTAPIGRDHFIGWYTPGSSIPVDTISMVVNGDMHLYPRFVAEGGVIRFRDLQHNIIEGYIHTIDALNTVDMITLRPTAGQAGVTIGLIIHWRCVENPSLTFFHIDGTASSAVQGLIDLVPVVATSAQVTFNLHGGTMSAPTNQNILPGNTVVRPTPDPTRVGWYFKHWSEYNPNTHEYEAYNSEFDFNTIINGATVLHAVWYGEHQVFAGFDLQLIVRYHGGLVSNSWVPVQTISIPASRYNFELGYMLDDDEIQLLFDTYRRGHPNVTHSRILNANPIAPPGAAVHQALPLNAEGTTVISLFFDPIMFDVIVDLSQELDAVTLTAGPNAAGRVTFNNASENQYTFRMDSQVWTGTAEIVRNWPRIPELRTQANINSGYATINRPGYRVNHWIWTDGINSGRTTGPHAMVFTQSDRDNPQAIIISPVWESMAGFVEVHHSEITPLSFGNFMNVPSTNPNATRHPIPFSDFIAGTFDEHFAMLYDPVLRTVIRDNTATMPYLGVSNSIGLSFLTESEIDNFNSASNYIIWNDDRTVAIRYSIHGANTNAFVLNAGAGMFAPGTPGLNATTGFVNGSRRSSWPILFDIPTRSIQPLPTPISPPGHVFMGWYTNASFTSPLLPPIVNPITGVFSGGTMLTNSTNNLMIHARYQEWPPEFIITNGLGANNFGTQLNTITPVIESGQSLRDLGLEINDLLPSNYHWETNLTEVPGRGRFSSWVFVDNFGEIRLFHEDIPMNAGIWHVFPVFGLQTNTVTFLNEDGSPLLNNGLPTTRSVFTDPALQANTILRGGGTNRTMPPISLLGGAREGHRFVWTTQENGNGEIFTASSQVRSNMNVHAFFEPMVTITYTAKDWGNGVVGGYVTNAFSQTIPARFGRGASEVVPPTVQNNIIPSSIATAHTGWEFAGWFLANAPINAQPISTDSLFIPSRNPHTNLFETATYEARFRAIINYVSENATLGTVTRAEERLFPNATAQGSTAQVTDPSGTRFVHWVSTRTGLPVNTDYVSGNTFTPSGATTLIEPDTFIAIFAQSGATEIQFNVAPTPGIGVAGGTVNPPEQHLLAFQAASSSVSTTFPGFAFSGWSVGSNPGSMITDTASFTRTAPANGWDNASVAERTFYAHFTEAANVQISYAVATGRGTVSRAGESVAPITGNAASVTATPAPGYRFDRWTTDLAGNNTVTGGATFTPSRRNIGGSVDVFEVDTTYFAHFVEDEGSVTIRYEVSTLVGNVPSSIFTGGSVDPQIQTGINPFSTELLDIDGSTPTAADGFEFVRWAFNPAGTDHVPLFWWNNEHRHLTPQQEAVMIDDSEVLMFIDRTFYAIFQPTQFTITYNLNSGTHTGNPITFNVTMPDIILADASRDGHAFLGWYTTNDFALGSSLPRSTDINNPGSILNTSPSAPDHVTLWARWQANAHTVTFVSTGHNADGNPPSTIDTTWGATNVTIPTNAANFAKDGHTFGGWRIGETDTIIHSGATLAAITGDVILTAVWNINRFAVEYARGTDATGDLPASHTNVAWNTNITISARPANLEREGHTFGGWNDGTTTHAVGAELTITSGLTLTAVWDVNYYYITYNTNTIGGVGTGTISGDLPIPQNVAFGAPAPVAANPNNLNRVGHTFGGWATSATSTTPVTGNLPMVVGGIELFAIWTPINYTVTFDENLQGSTLGDISGAAPHVITGVNYTNVVRVPANENSLTRTGHTLLGWSRDANATVVTYVADDEFDMPAANVTLFAIWEIQSREVIFVNNHNATDNTEHGRESTDYGSTLALPTPPSRTGYDFVGWFTARTGGTQFIASTVVREDTTVYARWQAHSHTIAFQHDPDGGTGNLPDTINTYFDEVETVPGQGSMARNGYTFVGWRDSISNSVLTEDALLTVSGNHELTAVWSRDGRFAVIYNANWPSLGDQDGQVPTSAYGNDYYTGQTVTVLDNNTLEVTGHTFLGWSRDANATTPDYVDGNTFAMGTTHVTLYAVWQIQERTLTYSAGTGTGTPPTAQTVNWSSSVRVSGQGGMSKEGHTFGDWTDADGNPVAEDAVLSLTDNMTLTAVWNINSYNVTYNANITGGAGAGAISGMPSPATVSIVFGETHDITATPSRVGHTFAGWATSPTATASDVVTSITMVVGGVNLYAVWTPINYAVTFDQNLQGSTLGTISGEEPNDITPVHYNATIEVPATTLERTGHTLLGWSTDHEATYAEFETGDTFVMADASVALYAVWSLNAHDVTVRHNTFAWDEAYTNAIEYDYETFTIYYGDDFEAEIIDIANHNFYADASDELVIAIMGDATVEINLFYQQHAYEFTLSIDGEIVTEIALDVNNRFPAADNALTWDEFTALFDVTTINLDADAYTGTAILPAPVLYSPNFQDVDFDNLTNETPFAVTVDAVWPDGQRYSLDIDVHIVDNIAPTITIAQSRVSFRTDAPPANMQAVIDAIGIVVEDNFDEAEDIRVEVSFAGSTTFETVSWTQIHGDEYREYALLVEAFDTSGNAASRSVVVVVIEDTTLGLTITMQPVADTNLNVVDGVITVTQGSINGYLEIEAIATEGAVITYQWYSSNEAVAGATSARMYIPTDLAVGTHDFQVMVTATINPSYSIMSNIIAVNVVAPSIPPTDEPSDGPSDEPGSGLPPSGGGDDSDTDSNNGDDNNNAGGGNNNDVENDNNNDPNVGGDTTNNDTNNQGETESNDVDEDTTPETTLPETPATTAPTTSVVEAEAPVSEIATESAPLPLTTADNMIQYGDMWIELDEAGVPLGAWNWDEETEMWIFDENVPLGAFATAAGAGAVLGAASTMPETGLTSNVGILAIFIAFALVIATAAFVLIKREQKNRNA